MKSHLRAFGLLMVGAVCCTASADVYHDYEGLAEGFLGETFYLPGVTYRDVNNVTGIWPDGQPFTPQDVGTELIIENAAVFYIDFPDYGSPVNVLTFGTSFIGGENLSLGALSSVWMDLDELSNAASLDLGFYENGPWGGIQYILEAVRNGQPVGMDSFFISDLGGRDNPAVRTMAISGVEFDSLHLYALLGGQYTVPRGIVDDLRITAVPEPAGIVLMGLLLAIRRRK